MGERTKLSKVLRVERRYMRTSPFTISSTDKCCTCICLSSSRKRNRDSPDQTTFFQRSKVKFWCSHAKGLWLTCDFAIPYKASCGALCLDSYMKLFSAISVILALFFFFFKYCTTWVSLCSLRQSMSIGRLCPCHRFTGSPSLDRFWLVLTTARYFLKHKCNLVLHSFSFFSTFNGWFCFRSFDIKYSICN